MDPVLVSQPYQLQQNTYFRLLVSNYFQRRKLMVIGVLLTIAALGLFEPLGEYNRMMLLGLSLAAVVGAVTVAFQYWRYAQNANQFDEKRLALYPDRIIFLDPETSAEKTTLRLDQLTRVSRGNGFYWLHVGRDHHHYVPDSAFSDQQLQSKFERALQKALKQ